MANESAPKYSATEYRVVDRRDVGLVYQAVDVLGKRYQSDEGAGMDVQNIGGSFWAGRFMRGPAKAEVRKLAGTLSRDERIVRIQATRAQLIVDFEETVNFVDEQPLVSVTAYGSSTPGERAQRAAGRTQPILRNRGRRA